MYNDGAKVTYNGSRIAQFGLPQSVVTDNGSCFCSEEFTSFLKNNGILHLKSAPYHPSTNGLAERAVQTFKQGMKKFINGEVKDRVSRFLAHYRMTPHTTTGVSPAELFLGRRPRTRLDIIRPSVSTRVDQKQLQQKRAHDDKAQSRKFTVGEDVYTWQFGRGSKNWVPGQIMEQTGPVSFWVELNSGTVVRRHQDQIRRRYDSVDAAIAPNLIEPPVTVTSEPSVTSTPPEPSVTLTPPDSQNPEVHSQPHSASSQGPDSTKQPFLEASVGRETPAARRYPERDRRPPIRLSYDS